MIERITDLPDRVLGLRASGEVTADDYKQVLVPALEEKLGQHRKVRLLYVIGEGFEEVILMGSTGWRLDHTLYNVQLLERFAGQLRILISGHHADTIRLGAGSSVSWDISPGVLFSVIPMCGQVTGVTLEGAMYPLLGETLEPGGPATISNRVTMSPLLISVGTGSLLVAVDRELGPEFIEDFFEDQ